MTHLLLAGDARGGAFPADKFMPKRQTFPPPHFFSYPALLRDNAFDWATLDLGELDTCGK